MWFIFLTIINYAIWSSIFAFGKIALMTSTPLFLTSIRMIFASVIILGFLLFYKRTVLKISRKELLPIFVLAFLSMYATNAFEFWGLQYLSAAKTCFIYGLSPFFAAIFSYIHFQEKMTLKKGLGMLIGFCGFLPVLLTQAGSDNLFKNLLLISWPELAIIAAAICSVYGWVLLRILVKKNELSPLTANGYSMLLGGVFALVHSMFIDKWSPVPITPGGYISFIQAIVLITFISNILCYNLYGFLLKKLTATFISFMGLLSPIFASFAGRIFLKEPLSPIILISTVIVLFGGAIVYFEEKKQGY
ncbi:MAG: DMT family transporter [Parachlamydiales bacterium]|nr:DMT family transporter [Parachlamydiales bacterium]